MNHIYSVLWNAALGRFCVTSELSRSRSRASTQRRALSPLLRPGLSVLATLVALAWAAPTWSQALPQGSRVVEGTAQVTSHGRQMTIQQGSTKAILDWQSFNIGARNSVQFVQPDAASVALNRVLGAEASAIHGALRANGQVFLVNPNGVLFGKSAQVNVGGLVASTLQISNADFLAGKYQFNGQGRDAQGSSVINQGKITADGGAVALLGGSVSNQGTIMAHLGSVALAAGNQITLDFAGDGLLNVSVDQSAFKALAANSGLIKADGGSVLMTAQATDALLQTVVNNTGWIRAHSVATRQGKIVLLGGMDNGTVLVDGALDASAATGDGGLVETRGARVRVMPTAKVTTTSAQGKAGVWHITAATDLNVSAGSSPGTDSGIAADALTNSLAKTSVTLQTQSTGDIHVNTPVKWNKNTLTLSAHRNVNIKTVMTAGDTAALAMHYGGHSATQKTPAAGSGVNMALADDGFIGRVDFTGRDAANASTNQLQINGQNYTLLTSMQAVQDIDQRLGGHYALAADIDAKDFKLRGYRPFTSDQDFKPIGASVDSPFSGQLEGLGHAISNLGIVRHDEPHVGLFGVSQGDISNLGMKGGSILGRVTSKALPVTQNGKTLDVVLVETGAFAGRMNGGSLRNVYTTASVKGSAKFGVSVTSSAPLMVMTGGAVGHVENAHIDNVRVNAAVHGLAEGRDPNDAYSAAGGAFGLVQTGIISNVDVQGSVQGQAKIRSAFSSYLRSVLPSYAADPGIGISFVGGAMGDQHGGDVHKLSAKNTVSEVTAAVRSWHPNYSRTTHVSFHAEVGSHAQATRSVTNEKGNANIDVLARPSLSLPEIAYRSLREHSAAPVVPAPAAPPPVRVETRQPSTVADSAAVSAEPSADVRANAAPGLAPRSAPLPTADSRLRIATPEMHSNPAYASATASAATTATAATAARQQTQEPVDEEALYSVTGSAIRLPAR